MEVTIKKIDGEYWFLSDDPAFVREWGKGFRSGVLAETLVANMQNLTLWASEVLDAACMFEMEV
jgi:hypothetical protein